jgi:hypothetical protein
MYTYMGVMNSSCNLNSSHHVYISCDLFYDCEVALNVAIVKLQFRHVL